MWRLKNNSDPVRVLVPKNDLPKVPALKSSLVDPSKFDLDKVIIDRDEIMETNPHRHEMMLLDGICMLTDEYAVGYADISEDDFWVRGHFPERPLMPGVLMCEAAAQLSAYYAKKAKLAETGTVGLGGLDSIKFRGPVVPGDRLVLMLKRGRVRHNVMFTAEFQGFVKDVLVVDGVIKGVVLNEPGYRTLRGAEEPTKNPVESIHKKD